MTCCYEGPWPRFDSETMGVDVETDPIVSTPSSSRTPRQPARVSRWLVNPGVPCPGATAIHGLTISICSATAAGRRL